MAARNKVRVCPSIEFEFISTIMRQDFRLFRVFDPRLRHSLTFCGSFAFSIHVSDRKFVLFFSLFRVRSTSQVFPHFLWLFRVFDPRLRQKVTDHQPLICSSS